MPVLYVVAAAFALLALWTQDGRGFLIAAVCVVVGTLQQVRGDRERRAAEAHPTEPVVDDWPDDLTPR